MVSCSSDKMEEFVKFTAEAFYKNYWRDYATETTL